MYIPEQFDAYIRQAHHHGRNVLEQKGMSVEPVEVAIAVENHRWAWRPPYVRVVLVAESHVFTSSDDLNLRVLKGRLPDRAQRAPEEFVRLIYCLGYGHNKLLTDIPKTPNTGTPQFWLLFARLAGTKDDPDRTSKDLDTRVRWKVRTLHRLSQMGVWLLDASLHAIYRPDAQSVGGKQKQLLHQQWWRHYGRYIVDELQSANPTLQVWVIGKTVFDMLRTEDGRTYKNWIYQPNARVGLSFPRDHGWADLLAAVCG